jgi:hypothetical protein
MERSRKSLIGMGIRIPLKVASMKMKKTKIFRGRTI